MRKVYFISKNPLCSANSQGTFKKPQRLQVIYKSNDLPRESLLGENCDFRPRLEYLLIIRYQSAGST